MHRGDCVWWCLAMAPLSLSSRPSLSALLLLSGHPPTCQPTPVLHQCLIDRSNYVFYWPVAREAGRHFIVSWAKGKNGYCSLSGKDDGHYSRRKQMMYGESLPIVYTLKCKQTPKHTHTHTHKVTECDLALKNLCFTNAAWQKMQSSVQTSKLSKHRGDFFVLVQHRVAQQNKNSPSC